MCITDNITEDDELFIKVQKMTTKIFSFSLLLFVLPLFII